MAAHGKRYTADSTVEDCEILEMWDAAGHLTVLAAGEVVIRDQPNPFWHGRIPFVRLLDSPVPHEFYGKGEIEPVLKLQYALDTVQNQLIDYKTQVLNRMWNVTGDIDEAELVFRPNGVIHGSQFDTAAPLEVQDISGTGVQELQALKEDIQQALGLYDYAKGGEGGANKTATGIGLVQEAANARFNHKIQLFEEFMREVGTFVKDLYQQFLTSEKQVMVDGPKGSRVPVRILPAQIAGDYDAVCEAGSSRPVDRNTERQDALNLYALFQQEPDPEFQYELKKLVLDKFDGTSDLEASLERAFSRAAQAQGQGDPAMAQADQQHAQRMRQQAQIAQAQMAQRQQQHEQQMQLKLADLQGKLRMEHMKATAAPHISEILPIDKLPPADQNALLRSVGLPGGAVDPPAPVPVSQKPTSKPAR